MQLNNKSRLSSIVFFPISLLYWGGVIIRDLLYRLKIFKTNKVSCKIISVGNVSIGGTGKTPTAIYLTCLLKNLNLKVAIISRGYKRNTKGLLVASRGDGPTCTLSDCGDEPYMMAKKLKNIPIVVDKNRYRGCTYLVNNFSPDVIIMDDGFQHKSIYRDMDLVLIDGSTNYNDYKLLPNGILREPWHELKRADAILVTKRKPGPLLKRKLNELSIPIFQTRITAMIGEAYQQPVKKIPTNEKVFLFSGIGNPQFFKKTIKHMGFNICGTKKFADHFSYSKKDVNNIEESAKTLNAKYLLTTEKDWFKLEKLEMRLPVIVIEIKIKVEKENEFLNLFNNQAYI
tara:strand:+ start:55 stop:1083 length:1029 start_codon:yes stop_codon:yes gene_type:complete